MYNETDFDKALDKAVDAIRTAQPDATAMESAAARVWSRLNESNDVTHAPVSGCADVQALLPAYRAGTLTDAREWLVQDHLRECPACRNAAQSAGARRVVAMPWRDPRSASKSALASHKLAWAAAIVITVGLTGWLTRDSFLPAPTGPRAALDWSDGPVYLVKTGGQQMLRSGGTIGEREYVRTASGTHAFLKLQDGSRVEMNQLAELGVSLNRRDTTIHLERGTIIVQAAKRRSGHLYVDTRDASVAVMGTIFAVNRGVKGTRVSVVEGEVHVDQRSRTSVLHPGDQVTTTRTLPEVPVREEIAWSRNADDYIKLLGEFSALAKQVQEIRLPGLRYESRLLGMMPADALVFATTPNLGDALAKAHQMFEDRMRESDVLRRWWEANGGASQDTKLRDLVTFLRNLSDYLGDEVAFVVTGTATQKSAPVIVAEVRKQGLGEFIDTELTRLNIPTKPPMTLTANWIAISPDAAALSRLQLTGGLAQQPFGQRIAEAYRDGAGFLFCADLSRLAPHQKMAKPIGTDDIQYLVIEQRQLTGATETRATLNFAGPRHGIASWLAAPAPMGSLDFVSPNATLAAAFIVKSPAQIVDDLFAIGETAHPGFRQELAKTEAETGVRFRDDLAASLGNDVTMSIDGPVLPTPAWKAVVEVHDPARVQSSIERLVAGCNTAQSGCAALEPQPGFGQRNVYALRIGPAKFQLLYTISDGYLIVAANSDTLQRSFRAKDGSWSLPQSGRLRSLLPADRQTNFSAVVYHNLQDIASVLNDAVNAGGNLTPEQRQAIQQLVGMGRPGLVYAYGSDDRIQIASTSGFFGLTLENLINSAGIAQVLNQRNFTAPRAGMRRGAEVATNGTRRSERSYTKQ